MAGVLILVAGLGMALATRSAEDFWLSGLEDQHRRANASAFLGPEAAGGARPQLEEELSSDLKAAIPIRDVGLSWHRLPERITDCWREASELGAGTFGAVWKAKCVKPLPYHCPPCPEHDKFFALKVAHRGGQLLTWHTPDAQSDLRRASEECATVQAIRARFPEDHRKSLVMNCLADHINIARNRDADILYLVLEYGGSSLGDFWAREVDTSSSPVLQRLALSLAEQLLQALAFLARGDEQNGYLHHDVKADNIIVRRRVQDGEVQVRAQLADFGAAVPARGPVDIQTVCNPNCPPEYNVYNERLEFVRYRAFEAEHPFAFDVFPMGTVLMVILADYRPMHTIFIHRRYIFRGTGVSEDFLEPTRFCRLSASEYYCRMKHKRAVFWKFLEMVRPTAAELLAITDTYHRGMHVYSKVFDPLRRRKGFSVLLDAIGDMYTVQAESRPTAAELLWRPELAGFFTDKNSQGKMPGLSNYRWWGLGKCAFDQGRQTSEAPCVSHALHLGQRDYLEVRHECEELCSADSGCGYFALSNRHLSTETLDCRLYTVTEHSREHGAGKACLSSTDKARRRLAARSKVLEVFFKEHYLCFKRDRGGPHPLEEGHGRRAAPLLAGLAAALAPLLRARRAT